MPRRKKPTSVFVIMPFGAPRSEDSDHFLSVYNDYIKPVVDDLGGSVLRADEITDSGSITADLVGHLANDDVVIADLTNSSANVFYELGIRHSLMKKGTILILDESKTENAPFDLSGYRVIRYQSTPQGLAYLKSELKKYLKQATATRGKQTSDNPVHDWIGVHSKRPTAASSAATSKGSSPSREEPDDTVSGIKEIIDEAMEEAESELIPKKIIEQTEDAVREDDLTAFLHCVNAFVDLNTFLPSDREFREMYYLAKRIDARSKVTRAILQLGLKLFPESRMLLSPYVSYLAHSTKKEDRQTAKGIVEDYLRIKRKKDTTTIEDITVLGKNTHLLSLMLDAYHRDGQHKEAFEITSSLTAQYPDNTVAIRNHARAMEKLGDFSTDEILSEYRKAVIVEEAADLSAMWFGNTLAIAGRIIDSLEAHIYACALDLDEPECFARLAEVMSNIVQPRSLTRISQKNRDLPPSIDRDTVIRCIVLAIDCPGYGAGQKFLCEAAMRNVGFGVEELEETMEDIGELTRTDRREFIEPLYREIRSTVTGYEGEANA